MRDLLQLGGGWHHAPFGIEIFSGRVERAPCSQRGAGCGHMKRAYGPGSPRRKCPGSVGVPEARAGILDVGSTGR